MYTASNPDICIQYTECFVGDDVTTGNGVLSVQTDGPTSRNCPTEAREAAIPSGRLR